MRFLNSNYGKENTTSIERNDKLLPMENKDWLTLATLPAILEVRL